MAPGEPAFTIGIEEEYLLVDLASRDLCAEPPPSMLADCEDRLTGQVGPEFLKAQIEVATRVCRSVAEARADLAHLRATVAQVAAGHGRLALLEVQREGGRRMPVDAYVNAHPLAPGAVLGP